MSDKGRYQDRTITSEFARLCKNGLKVGLVAEQITEAA
jgi:hypothetical protein